MRSRSNDVDGAVVEVARLVSRRNRSHPPPRRRRRPVLSGDGFDIPGAPCRLRWATTFSTSASDTTGPYDARDAAAAGHVEHVALAEQLFGACSPRIVRESILEVTWKEMRVGKFALIVPVDDVDGGALRRHDQVDAGGPRHLGEALDGALDVPCRRPSSGRPSRRRR